MSFMFVEFMIWRINISVANICPHPLPKIGLRILAICMLGHIRNPTNYILPHNPYHWIVGSNCRYAMFTPYISKWKIFANLFAGK